MKKIRTKKEENRTRGKKGKKENKKEEEIKEKIEGKGEERINQIEEE